MSMPDFIHKDSPPRTEAAGPHQGDTQPAYRVPRLVLLGRAAELIRRDQVARLKDGTGGGWVYGS
jgi:hypothetical protein